MDIHYERPPDGDRELILAPAVKGPWGVTDRLGGPPIPREEEWQGVPEEVRRADGLLRRGMIALARWEGGNKEEVAEECFREALFHMYPTVEHTHPLVVYAYDRIGYACHAQGRLDEAEELYLTSIELSRYKTQPTIWNEMTLLNLAILYNDQNRLDVRDMVMEELRRVQRVTAQERGGGDDDLD
jgi:tetratricopeptide (TPR) repeat protein